MLEVKQILSLRGRRSRNKVTVDESAVGSLTPKLIPLSLVLQLTKTYENENFQRWISRFPYRGRTQRTAISNANCRIRETSDFRTQHAPRGNSLGQVCFSASDYPKTKCD
jgi:hypothetical protein